MQSTYINDDVYSFWPTWITQQGKQPMVTFWRPSSRSIVGRDPDPDPASNNGPDPDPADEDGLFHIIRINGFNQHSAFF